MPTSHSRATLIGLCAILCWSTSVGLFRSVAEHLGPVGGAACVFTLSALFVTLRFGIPRWQELRTLHPVYLLGCGVIFVAYEIGLSLSLGFASNRTQTLELGMINYLWPSLTVVLATALGLQRFHVGLVPGVLLAMVGIVLVLQGDGAHFSISGLWANVQSNPLAYGLAFAAALLWPCYSVLSRIFAKGGNALSLFLWAVAAALWLHFFASDEPAMHFGWSGVAQLTMLSALTALGYSCWDYGIRHGNLTVMAVGSYFTPVLSALVGTVWLQVRPSWSFWQGVALVTLGSLICWWSTRERKRSSGAQA